MVFRKALYLVVGVIVIIIISKNKENTTLTCSSIFSKNGDVPKIHCGIFIRIQCYGKYRFLCMENMLCLVMSCVNRERMKTTKKNIQILLRIMRQKRNFLLQFH